MAQHATGLKVTFPDRFVASWSSSGVVNARFDYTQFDGHLVSVLPPACLTSLRSIMGNFSTLWDNPTTRPGTLGVLWHADVLYEE